MPRWLRWTGRLLAGLLLLIVVAVAAVYVVSSLAIRKTYRFPDSAVRAATDSASLAWGRHLMEAVTKCQECHDGDLGGKVMIDDPAFARLATANLTGGRGGIAEYTDADLERAIRHGVGRDGRPLIFMPSDAYGALTDEDLAALLGYLRTFKPVDREHARSSGRAGRPGAVSHRQVPPPPRRDDPARRTPRKPATGRHRAVRPVSRHHRRLPFLPRPAARGRCQSRRAEHHASGGSQPGRRRISSARYGRGSGRTAAGSTRSRCPGSAAGS